jgi:hypothetical protein
MMPLLLAVASTILKFVQSDEAAGKRKVDKYVPPLA